MVKTFFLCYPMEEGRKEKRGVEKGKERVR
jgi:hypothetical protein